MSKSIENLQELIKVVQTIAFETSAMAQKTLGRTFPITSLTVFSHSDLEYRLLTAHLKNLGEPYNYNNGPRIKLAEPIIAGDNQVAYLRIRKPDIDRPQLGCNDFETDYELFKKEYLNKYPENLNLIIRPEYEMIELQDDKFDVLAYIVSS